MPRSAAHNYHYRQLDRAPLLGHSRGMENDDDFALRGGLDALRPAEPPVGGGVLTDWLVQDYREASAVLKRRKAETLAEAAQILVNERDAARAKLRALESPPLKPSSPDVIAWDSRGLRLRRYLESPDAKLVRYAAKVGNVSFDLAVSQPHPDRYDATLGVMLANDGDPQYRTSSNLLTFRAMGATAALAAEETMRDCDIRLLTLARELTWGLKVS